MAKFKFYIQTRVTKDICPKCSQKMISIHLTEDGWYWFIAGGPPKCFRCRRCSCGGYYGKDNT